MGAIISRFRKKQTTVQKLEYLEKEINTFEKFKLRNESNERKYIGALILYSILFYVVGAVVYYIYFMPTLFSDRVKTLSPFLITPLIIYGIRKFLKWFYIKRTVYFERKLEDLKDNKKNILDDVKENETYKKAKEILERFSTGMDITPPTSPVNSMNQTRMMNTSIMSNVGGGNNNTPHQNQNLNKTMAMGGGSGTQLVHRNVKQLQQGQGQQQQKQRDQLNQTTVVTSSNSAQKNNNSGLNASMQVAPPGATPNLNQQQQQQQLRTFPPSGLVTPTQQGPQAANQLASNAQARTVLPRPIVGANRSLFERFIDVIVGEGPNNRYALICKSCHFHNGMALKEEFEYVAFRCAYCLFYNEARKTKPHVPRSAKTSISTTSSSSASSGLPPKSASSTATRKTQKTTAAFSASTTTTTTTTTTGETKDKMIEADVDMDNKMIGDNDNSMNNSSNLSTSSNFSPDEEEDLGSLAEPISSSSNNVPVIKNNTNQRKGSVGDLVSAKNVLLNKLNNAPSIERLSSINNNKKKLSTGSSGGSTNSLNKENDDNNNNNNDNNTSEMECS